jgi:hypothetical protein
MTRAFALLMSLYFYSWNSGAAITSVAVDTSTVSAYAESLDTKIIFGGYGGSIGGCATPSISAVCDSCSGMGNLGTIAAGTCNNRSVHANLLLTIDFAVDTIPSGSSVIAKYNTTVLTGITAPTVISPGSTIKVQIPWGTLCAATGESDSGCSIGDFTGGLSVGVSNGSSSTEFSSEAKFTVNFQSPVAVAYTSWCPPGTNGTADEGFCYLTVAPGDEKVFVKNVRRADVDQGGAVKFSSLRVYFKEALNASDASAFAAIPIGAGARFKDLGISDISVVDSNLSGNAVDGDLINDRFYAFAFASVDQAGNVTNFSDPGDLTVADHIAQPQLVIGLLEKKQCFIATAAYGSPWQTEVNVLRAFKNQVLLRSKLGQKFVQFYYRHSPAIAEKISESEFLKTIVRATLTPWVWLARLLVKSEPVSEAAK